MATSTYQHSTIGTLKPRTSKEGVLQFLGLQYATLADRFAPAVIKEYSQDQITDASRIGPSVVALAPNADFEQALIQHTLEYDKSEFRMSDTEALCLNVTIPTTESKNNLPVFAFIHGGGFVGGSSIYPQYDLARLVQLGVKNDMSFIAISISYRLGAYGFLTSSDLTSAGYKPNNAFRDQRTALLWIQKHISGFGGDPENVTLMGESAGGISTSYHLFSQQPLFKRMMLMSGTILLMPPMPPQFAEQQYLRAMKILGLQDASPEDRVKALLNLPAPELTQKLMSIPNMPVLDGDLCPSSFTFESVASGKTTLPGAEWCEASIIGDCQFDGSINALRLGGRKKDIGAAFCSSITSSLASTPGIVDKLLSAYGLKSDLADDEAYVKVLQVTNDIQFYAPTFLLAQNLEKKTRIHMYRFNEPNPWDGPWKGEATHILDLALLLQNYSEFLVESVRTMGEEFALNVITFVHGKDPWARWREGEKFAEVLGPHGKMEVVEDVPEKVARRDIILRLAEEVGYDKLNDALRGFMTAPPPV